MQDSATIRKVICDFLAEGNPADQRLIESDADLFDGGVIDSFKVVSLAVLIEEKFGVAIDFERVEESDFRTLSSLVNLVRSSTLQ